MTDNPLDLDDLGVKLKSTLAMRDHGQAERDRNIVKTGALLSIAKSLEAKTVPDNWEALEGPSGAVLGWFDPQVARAIAQALGASQERAAEVEPDEGEAHPIEVGSFVALTEALERLYEDTEPGAQWHASVGRVEQLGIDQDEAWALVNWGTEPDGRADTGRLWVRILTVVDPALVAATSDDIGGDRLEYLPNGGTPETKTDEAEPDTTEASALFTADDDVNTHEGEPGGLHVAPVTSDNDGFDIEPDDGAGDPAPEPEVDDDDLDADFDTVVEDAPPVDGLSALKAKTKKGGK